jgi:hypothetical protein
MCIITSTVESVSGTKIYVSSDETNRRQITLYSNRVNTPVENAMILAVPNPSSVKFLNFSQYTTVFDDLESCFEHPFASLPLRSSLTDSAAALAVYSVGSYNASIVETLDDFGRLDEEVFDVAEGLFEFLQQKYGGSGLGFIVCQLKPGNHTYHPFAYTHHQHPNGRLFIPAMHYHPNSNQTTDAYEDDWDHIIYSPATNLRSPHWDGKMFKENVVNWSKFPREYRWAMNAEIDRWEKYGRWENRDLFATHTTDPRKWSA